jgi:replicative DNA helicase
MFDFILLLPRIFMSLIMAEKRTTKSNTITMPINSEMGKMPPQDVKLEEVVIGAMLLEKEAYTIVADILKQECFYREEHQYIFEAITKLSLNGNPIDMLTVTEELRRMGKLEEAGGAFYIAQLTNRVASAAHIEYHSRIIFQKFIQREIIRLSGIFQTQAYDETVDVEDLLEEAESSLFLLSQGNMTKEAEPISQVIVEAIEKIQLAAKKPEGLSGVPSGFIKLDSITSGWQNSDMIIIAARPSMGKTAFVLTMARNMAVKYKQAVAIFSLEMPNVQLANRLIISETELDAEKIKNGKLSTEEWNHFYNKIRDLENAPIFIDDTAGLSIFELRAKCRRLKKMHDIKIIIIDYLQLMNASGIKISNRQEEVSIISRSLKALAKELNIPIIALSQLNRNVEARKGGYLEIRPHLSDLRESGAIEQDADMVLLIHRPEVLKIYEDNENVSTLGVAEIIIAKHRNGRTGEVKLSFRPEVIRFEDRDETGFDNNNYTESVQKTYSSKMNTEALPPADNLKTMPFESREAEF